MSCFHKSAVPVFLASLDYLIDALVLVQFLGNSNIIGRLPIQQGEKLVSRTRPSALFKASIPAIFKSESFICCFFAITLQPLVYNLPD
jgi:hypothetical protein